MTPARVIAGIVFCAFVAAQSRLTADVWEPLRFLVGSWEGDVNGRPGQGKSAREYRFVLNNQFLEVRNKSTYPVQPKNPKGEVHEDWGMISYDRNRKRFVLRQFHGESFVNQYASESGKDGSLLFISENIENIPAGFRARETYTITGPDTFTERFEIAEPGKDFEVYDETVFRRKR